LYISIGNYNSNSKLNLIFIGKNNKNCRLKKIDVRNCKNKEEWKLLKKGQRMFKKEKNYVNNKKKKKKIGNNKKKLF